MTENIFRGGEGGKLGRGKLRTEKTKSIFDD